MTQTKVFFEIEQNGYMKAQVDRYMETISEAYEAAYNENQKLYELSEIQGQIIDAYEAAYNENQKLREMLNIQTGYDI
jgi:cell division septum initiation protein DivIVA